MGCAMVEFTGILEGPAVSVFRVYFGDVVRTVTHQVLYLTSVRREACPRHYETARRARRLFYPLAIFSVLFIFFLSFLLSSYIKQQTVKAK